jgi:PIN domain nuclease of toxin-antitoxin system
LIYLMDTPVWIWWHSGSANLSEKVHKILENPKAYDELLLSAISLWEFSKLLEKGRISCSSNPEEWVGRAMDMAKLRLVPLTPKIAYQSTTLPGQFYGDPADQILVATAREEDATLLTADKQIRAYRHVRSLW